MKLLGQIMLVLGGLGFFALFTLRGMIIVDALFGEVFWARLAYMVATCVLAMVIGHALLAVA